MEITIPVNHNFYEEKPISEDRLQSVFNMRKGDLTHLKEIFNTVHEVIEGDKNLEKIKILNFRAKRSFVEDSRRPILKMYSKQGVRCKEYYIQTGLYAGVLFHKGCRVNITTRYGNVLLHRMLNFVLDIYVDNTTEKADRLSIDHPYLHVLKHLFIKSLEKAAILGLPQQYQRQVQRSSKVRGKINITEYLKRDIPFQGKITTTFNERKYIPEFVDILHVALTKIEKLTSTEDKRRILGIKQLLQQEYSGCYPDYQVIENAKKHPALANPMYFGFRNVLLYAEIILKDDGITDSKNANTLSTHGYLFDVAELYEIYLEKLLSRNLKDWYVSGQMDIPIYKEQFFRRSMFPDIVLTHRFANMVAVFDAKFKKMDMLNGDVDRSDLHQIHCYAAYYGSELTVAGLLYPLSKKINTALSHCQSLYGNNGNQAIFAIDGIHVNDQQSFEELTQAENDFIRRITNLLQTGMSR